MIKSLWLICMFAAAGWAQVTAAPTFSRSYIFPPAGLSSTETAQVSLVNMAAGSGASSTASASCTGSVTFTDSSGKTVGSAVTYTTTGSQIFSTQLTFSQLGATGTRSEFVASVQQTSSSSSNAPCSLRFSLETFDTTTGATHIYLGNTAATAAVGLFPVFTH